MKQLFRILDRSLEGILFVVLFSMVLIVASNVFGRFILGSSISWGEEVAKILLTYLTFFGAAYVMKDNSHYTFDFLIQKMPHRWLPYFLGFRWLVIILISSLLLYWSVEVTLEITDWIMPSTGINRAFVYGVTPVSMIFLLLYAIRNFIANLKNPVLYMDIADKI
ncbi:TRAP transporter small permease [Reichenbachiella sp. MALMAid0571]|uniref:TRAP transporter small permease n=1 Tax=Reichenbachiella sp. MALMAid0571 TaxID=3143939 RepID=UPI0032DF56DA